MPIHYFLLLTVLSTLTFGDTGEKKTHSQFNPKDFQDLYNNKQKGDPLSFIEGKLDLPEGSEVLLATSINTNEFALIPLQKIEILKNSNLFKGYYEDGANALGYFVVDEKNLLSRALVLKTKKDKHGVTFQKNKEENSNTIAINLPKEIKLDKTAAAIIGHNVDKGFLAIRLFGLNDVSDKFYIFSYDFKWDAKAKNFTEVKASIKVLEKGQTETKTIYNTETKFTIANIVLTTGDKRSPLRVPYKVALNYCEKIEKDDDSTPLYSLANSEIVEVLKDYAEVKILLNQINDPDRCVWTNTPVPNRPNYRYIWSYKVNAVAIAHEEFGGCQPLCVFKQ